MVRIQSSRGERSERPDRRAGIQKARKRHRVWLLSSLALLVFLSIPVGCWVCEYRQAKRDYALIQAVKANDTARAMAALRAGADVNARDYSEDAFSFRVLFRRFSDRVFHPNVQPTSSGHPTVLLCLLEANYGRADSGSNFPTPQSENATLLALLLDHGADVNARGEKGVTPLMLAASHGLNASINLLLQHGSDIEAQSENGMTSLMFASVYNYSRTTQLLIRHHAAINRKDKCGSTAFDYAFANQSWNRNIVAILWVAGAKTGRNLDEEKKRGGER